MVLRLAIASRARAICYECYVQSMCVYTNLQIVTVCTTIVATTGRMEWRLQRPHLDQEIAD